MVASTQEVLYVVRGLKIVQSCANENLCNNLKIHTQTGNLQIVLPNLQNVQVGKMQGTYIPVSYTTHMHGPASTYIGGVSSMVLRVLEHPPQLWQSTVMYVADT